jgi:hypothetical protein
MRGAGMTKRKAELAEEGPPRDQWVPKHGLKDPGTRIDPNRVSELIDRVFA